MRARGLAAALLGLAVATSALWPSAELDAPEPAQGDTSHTTQRDSPSRDEVSRRRRARLARRYRGTPVETRLVTVRALRCGLLPAPGVRVSVDMGAGPVEAGDTDDLGKLVVRVPSSGAHTFIATLDDFDGAAGPTRDDAVNVNACPGATVAGTVLDPAGRPVAGAEVVLGDEQDVAVTDEEGHFLVTDLFLTALSLSARKGGLSAETSLEPPLEPREERTVTLRLEPGRRLVGVVLDRDGSPVPKATVMALAGPDTLASTRADRRGRFWLKGVPFVPLTLRALSDQGASRPLAVGETEARSDLVLTVEPGALLVFKGGGAGATYRVFDKRRPGRASVREVVGEGGRAVVDAPGQYEVFVSGADDDRAESCGEVGVFPGDLVEIDCGAKGPATVTGRVVDIDGDPIGGASVYAFGSSRSHASQRRAQAQSAQDGSFSVTLAQRGQVTVAAFLSQQGAGYGRKAGIPVSPGVVSDAGDVTILTREQRRAMVRQRQFYGVGAVLARTAQGPVFQRIVQGGPLSKAGVKAYDVILAVDGQGAYNESVTGLVRKLRGEAGTEVHLTLWRDGQEIEINVERGAIDADHAF